MKILHVCIASAFTPGMNYQDNILADCHARDGHQVLVISDCECFENGVPVAAQPGELQLDNGITLKRMPYDRVICKTVSAKLRKIGGLYDEIEKFSPDVILFHDMSSWELLNVAKYVRRHPQTRLFVDTHADANNSASNFLSKTLLHRGLYRAILHRALPEIRKIFYVAYECGEFAKKMYRLPDSLLEYLPLGGYITEPEAKAAARGAVRTELGLADDDIVFLHSGKMDPLKRTAELLRAFSAVKDPKFRLLLAGSLTDATREEILQLVQQDGRVRYLGWKTGSQLMDLLCACDMYLQPGSQSATLQNSMCCGCAVMIYPHNSYRAFIDGNGFYVRTQQEMTDAFTQLSAEPGQLKPMGERSLAIARELLDYRKQAARLY